MGWLEIREHGLPSKAERNDVVCLKGVVQRGG
jgi:hypothetical protein